MAAIDGANDVAPRRQRKFLVDHLLSGRLALVMQRFARAQVQVE